MQGAIYTCKKLGICPTGPDSAGKVPLSNFVIGLMYT